MTIIAGAISRNGAGLPPWLRSALVSNISRERGDVPESFEGDGWLLAHLDIGVVGGKGSSYVPGGNALVMAGEPLIRSSLGTERRSREQDRDAIFNDLSADRTTAIEASTGVFCAAFYSSEKHALTLIADKLSIRPIYYLVTPEFAVFSSAFRIFEAAGLLGAGIDQRGVYEACVFGCSLGNRTSFEDVRVLGAAELVHITRNDEQHDVYFRWDRLTQRDGDESEIIESLTGAFDSAVRKRLRGDRVALSFLSGGLDSRTIVSALLNNGTQVVTVNFAPPGTQDRDFARLAAEVLGTRHYQLDVPISTASDIYRQKELRRWVGSLADAALKPERPHCIWSGDGGSMGMGHIYQDAATVAAFASGDVEAGIREFIRYNRLHGASNSAMTSAFRQRSRGWHIDGIRREIAALDRKVDGRTAYLFLLLNDQRRHMFKHFEQIDVNRFEFLMPFYDSDFLETVVRWPAEPFLLHALYHKWLASMRPVAVTVPWQTYPDHVPCPIRSEGNLRYQWGDYYGNAEERRLARNEGRAAVSRYFNGDFPSHLVSRVPYGAAIAASLLGSGEYSHVVRVGDAFTRAWQQHRAAAATRRPDGSTT